MDGTSFDRLARLLGATASRRTGLFAAVGMALGLTAAASEEEILAGDAADDEAEAEKKKKRKRCRPSLIGKGTKIQRRRSRCRRNNNCCSLICVGKRRKKKKHHHKKDAELTGLLATEVELDEHGFDEAGYEDYLDEEDDEDEQLQGFTFAGDVEVEKHKKRRRRRRCRCRKAGATCKQDVNCCEGRSCVNGTCSGKANDKVPTGESCDGDSDTCAAADATCTTYSDPTNGQGTFCLLANSLACSNDGDCVEGYCQSGVCATCTLAAAGADCAADSDCCSGFCSIIDGAGRCIGHRTVWARLSWNQLLGSDLDTWVWMPQSVPSTATKCVNPLYSTISFPDGGATVSWEARWYPATIADPAIEVPDAWLDVDDTYGPGAERFLWFKPVPGGTYRYAVKSFWICYRDSYSTTSCGPDWANIAETHESKPLTPFVSPTYDAKVEFFEHSKLIRTFNIPATRTGTDPNPNHYYWWNVSDLSFDANGWFVGFTTPNGTTDGEIRNCAPAPYIGNMCDETSFICAL